MSHQPRQPTIREVWSGIDFHRVQLLSECGVVVLDDAFEAVSFIRSENDVKRVKAPDALRDEIADLFEMLAPV